MSQSRPCCLARERGFFESSHVTWLGKTGWKDWELKQFILKQDWTFVTRNSTGLSRPLQSAGFQRPVCGRSYSRRPGLHQRAGLNVREDETELFGIVLDELGPNEMVNQAIEITLSDADTGFELVRYALPRA